MYEWVTRVAWGVVWLLGSYICLRGAISLDTGFWGCVSWGGAIGCLWVASFAFVED